MPPRTKTTLFTLLCLLVLLAGAGTLLARTRHAGEPANLNDSATPFDPSVWAWRNEEHWAVDQMAKDLAELLFAAAGKDPSTVEVTTLPSGPRTYTVTLTAPRFGKPCQARIQLVEYLWNPAMFAPLAKDLATRLDLKPGTSPSSHLLQDLTSPTAAALEQAQASVSLALNAHPASAGAHEEAALVLGVLGLFDQAGAFQDHRGVLNRMVAHLALAGVLGQEAPKAEGRLARTALLILMGRCAQADGEVARFKDDPALPAPWTSTFHMLATGDWRNVDDPATVSLAEALAAFRGRSEHLGRDQAAEWILSRGQTRLPMGYLARVTLLGTTMSVAMGGRLAPDALSCDTRDLQAVATLRKDGPLPAGLALGKALSAHPGRAWNPSSKRLEVIGWGLWAQHFQALFLDDMMKTINYYNGQLGSSEDTQAYLDFLEANYRSLDQFPMLQKRYANLRPAIYRKAILEAAAFAQQHPELVSDCSWTSLNHPVGENPLPKALPRYQAWLQDLEPFGTAYNWTWRVREMTETSHLNAKDMTAFLNLDPTNTFVIGDYFFHLYPGGRYTVEAVETGCAALKAFDQECYLQRLLSAYPEHAPQVLPVLRALAGLNPNWLFRVAKELASQNQQAEASTTFLKAYKACGDRVTASNSMTWEVVYLHSLGRDTEAEAIAQECAEVYSGGGLKTLALLRELQGRLPEAEQEYQNVEQRYGDAKVLQAFYYRNARKTPAYQRAWDQGGASLFPGGLRRFETGREPLPPLHGVTLQDYNGYISHKGLDRDVVIVGLDGFKVDNIAQYLQVRAFRWQDQMSLVVFQGGRYVTLDLELVNRQFGVNLLEYQPTTGAKP